MPATVAIAAAVSGAAGAAGAALTGAAVGAAFLSSALSGAFAAGVNYLMRPDDPDEAATPESEIRQTVRSPISPARWILGRARVGGVLVYATEDKDDPATLWMVQALGEGPMDSIERIWFGDEEVEVTRSAAGVVTPVDGDRYHGAVTIWEVFAGDGAVDGAGPTALRTASDGEWSSAEKGEGVAYVIVRLRQSSSERLFTGIPTVNYLVKGMKITWPGQTTPTWSENAAALRYWFMRTRRGIPASAFDEASVTDAIAVCDQTVQVSRPSNAYADWPASEPRYTVNGVIKSGDSAETIERGMDWAWQGWAVEFDGTFHFRPGVDRNSVANILDSDILAVTGCTTCPALQDRMNAATMTLRQSNRHDWLEYAVPEVSDAEAVARDGSRMARDLGPRMFIASPSAADRMLRIFLRRHRASFKVSYLLSPRDDLHWLSLKPCDVVTVTDSQLGLSSWRAMVVRTTMRDDWSVEVHLEDCPDRTWADLPGLGQLGRPYLRIPRRNDPPAAIEGATATVLPRVSTDGAVFWSVKVTVPAAPLGFAARMVSGDVTDEKRTLGSSVEFDFDAPRTDIEVTVWRETDGGVAGPTRTIEVTPEYSAIDIPTAALKSWQDYAGILAVELADPQSRVVAGAEFRCRTVAADSSSVPGSITAESWLDAERLDALPVVLAPGQSAVFNVTFPRTAKYRIAARYIDNVGRLGPVAELGVFILAIPAVDHTNVAGAPAWRGTSQFLAAHLHGAQTLLLPDRDAVSSLTAAEWNGYSDRNRPDGYRHRRRTGGAVGGDWSDYTTVAGTATGATVTGLTNGTEYEFEVQRVDGGTPGATATVTATPVTDAEAPPKPTMSLAAGYRSITVTASVVEDSRAPVTSWQYRIATSQSGLSSAPWRDFIGAAGPSLTRELSELAAGTARWIQVRAVNSVGNGTPSDAESATPASATVPSKPSLSLQAISGLSWVTITGSVATQGGSEITRWEARWATSISGLAGTAWSLLERRQGDILTQYSVKNLEYDTLYYFEVRAMNSVGYSPVSDRVSVTTSSAEGDPAPGGAGAAAPDAPPPTGLSAWRVGTTGVRAAWSAPVASGAGHTLTGYEMEYRTSPSGAWVPWDAAWPADQTQVTVAAGVSGDDAWRLRAVYAGGPTGTVKSNWAEVSIDAVFNGAAGAAATEALVLTATESSGEVALSWDDPNLGAESFWPWGQCEGYDAAFDAQTSTWWRSELVDMEATKSLSIEVEVEHFEPPLIASGAGGATGAAEDAPDAGPMFAGDLGSQVWATGAAIAALDLPPVAAGDQTVTVRVDGLPRGVKVTADLTLEGTPSLAAGTRGVARITATTPDGLADHSYFEWVLAATAPKSGTGSLADGYALSGTTPQIADIRDWLLPGETNAAALAAAADDSDTIAVPTYFAATVPAGEAWSFNLWDPDADGDGEDFDLIEVPQSGDDRFHVTTGGRERHTYDNAAGASASTRRIGVYVYATATDTDSVNANEEGTPAKPKVMVSWSPEARTGRELAEEWEGYASAANAAVFAPGSESVTDISVHHGTSANSLTKAAVTGGSIAVTARYVQVEVHLRKWRGRALKQVTMGIREN